VDKNEQRFLTAEVGSAGWKAPEILLNLNKGKPVDIFSLGCIYFFLATGGQHPFGDIYQREQNILNGLYSLELLENDYELRSLVGKMIEKDARKRYTIKEVNNHPFFWDEGRKLSVFQEFSDYIESQYPKQGDHFETKAKSMSIVPPNWDRILESSVMRDLQNYRQYDFKSTKELIRVIRNKKNHYYELPMDSKITLGKMPDGVFNYFNSKFPKLFMFIYDYCKENDIQLYSLAV